MLGLKSLIFKLHVIKQINKKSSFQYLKKKKNLLQDKMKAKVIGVVIIKSPKNQD